jgi:hypothetical protein
VTAEVAFEIAFAAGILAAALALLAAAAGRGGTRLGLGVAAACGAGSVAGWIAFALDPNAEVAVSAAGLAACALAATGAVALRRGLDRSRAFDEALEHAKAQLRQTVEEETAGQAAELERLLGRARADAFSRLAEEERRIAEERRRAVVEQERVAGAELGEALAAAQRRVEQRLAEWARDLERTQDGLAAQLGRLGERQRQLIAAAEVRIVSDVDRLEADTEERRAAVTQARSDIERMLADLTAAATAELEQHGADRRRALHELGERLRRRERELGEQIDREEAEATQRIHAGLGDVERRQVEQLERAVARATSRYSEEATLQFAAAIKSAREDAARRLSRELDRAVESFAREASGLLTERLQHVADAGAQRLEKRLGQIAAGLERQREEAVGDLGRRLGEAEDDFRRHLESLSADVEAERTIIEARLHELSRRMDDTLTAALARVEARAR